jgi:GntR family transcriptional regulator
VAIDPNTPVPIYRQIADHIRGGVAAGVYRPGEAIPSLRALALELVVNPNTVQRAYEELEREGLVQARRGLGMFVADGAVESARRASEAALYSAFVRAIAAGQAASVPADRIRAAFDRAWEAAQGRAGVPPENT